MGFKSILLFFILFFGISFSYPQAKFEVNMQLAKDTFKMYEPVLAKLDVINRDVKPFSFYYLFDKDIGYIHFKIVDNIGNVWDSNKTQLIDDIIEIGPRQIINPGDTFIISVPINNWCERHGMFSQSGHFPSGRKYKAFFYYGDNHSNEVEFNVVEPNEEDKDIYTEYIGAGNFLHYYIKIIKGEQDFDSLLEDYKDFFKKFPNSFYMYDDNFMAPLYYVLNEENFDINDLIKDMKKRFNNKNLDYFLNHHSTFNRIEVLIKRISLEIR